TTAPTKPSATDREKIPRRSRIPGLMVLVRVNSLSSALGQRGTRLPSYALAIAVIVPRFSGVEQLGPCFVVAMHAQSLNRLNGCAAAAFATICEHKLDIEWSLDAGEFRRRLVQGSGYAQRSKNPSSEKCGEHSMRNAE